VLVLRDIEGLSGDETADVLGLSLRAMKSRLHRARLRLVVVLREELKHEG
jgi:RNA polymerase sigma-70 factor (ECF subfamily)